MGDLADQYVTLRQAAEILGVSKARVEQYVGDGRLPLADTVGGVRLVRRTAVAAMGKLVKPRGRPTKTKKPRRGGAGGA